MLPDLIKKLLTASNGAEFTTPAVDQISPKAACFQYTFLGDDGRNKGGVVLEHKANIYSNFSLTTFGLVPITSSESVFYHKALGEVLIDFKVNFAEGDEMDSLKGTLAMLDWQLKTNEGRWKASVRSSEREVALVKGTWSRSQV